MNDIMKLAPKELMDALVEAVGDLPDESAMDMARRIAIKVVRLYGEGGQQEQETVENNDIRNDHPAVQASLETMREILKHRRVRRW